MAYQFGDSRYGLQISLRTGNEYTTKTINYLNSTQGAGSATSAEQMQTFARLWAACSTLSLVEARRIAYQPIEEVN